MNTYIQGNKWKVTEIWGFHDSEGLGVDLMGLHTSGRSASKGRLNVYKVNGCDNWWVFVIKGTIWDKENKLTQCCDLCC